MHRRAYGGHGPKTVGSKQKIASRQTARNCCPCLGWYLKLICCTLPNRSQEGAQPSKGMQLLVAAVGAQVVHRCTSLTPRIPAISLSHQVGPATVRGYFMFLRTCKIPLPCANFQNTGKVAMIHRVYSSI